MCAGGVSAYVCMFVCICGLCVCVRRVCVNSNEELRAGGEKSSYMSIMLGKENLAFIEFTDNPESSY